MFKHSGILLYSGYSLKPKLVNAQTIILGNPNYSKKDSVVNLIILIAIQ